MTKRPSMLGRVMNPNGRPVMRKHPFLDTIREKLGLRSDSALADRFEYCRPFITHVRSGRIPVSDELLICAHLSTGMTIAELKKLRLASGGRQPGRRKA